MFKEILDKVILQNTITDYLVALLIFLAGIFLLKLIRKKIIIKLDKVARETSSSIDDFLCSLLEKIAVPFFYCIALYLAVKYLTLTPFLDKIVNTATVGVLVIFTVRLVIRVINYGMFTYWAGSGRSTTAEHSLSGVSKVIQFILWSLGVIFFLDNLGFEVSAVLAGLGVGGVAIALAAQAVLKDLFSYLSILFDRPFEIGDFIIVGDLLGTVEHIGIKTTRIKSLGGEQLVFSNSDLTDSRLRNYKRMDKRRVVFKIGVIYSTPLAKLKEIPHIIERIVKDIPDTNFDRAHFFQFGDFSLIYEVVYYVIGSDYNKYMDIQQEINFNIKKELEERGIEFAFPTQTLYINKQ
ncbi:MAG: mechanosensitive ion channel [Candidatus Omnitrophica bacterium]|nr:mechanosensitive ion channel [Candidatus Omnitrophota bacterium]MBD3269438.1 mechanosensitive ion channel [Candidatus Omnitrophota bacterium]